MTRNSILRSIAWSFVLVWAAFAVGTIADDNCYNPAWGDCPEPKQYCKLRTESQCKNGGQENYEGFFTKWNVGPNGLFDTTENPTNNVPCWADCTCVWDEQEDECVCEENTIEAPHGRNEYEWLDCIDWTIPLPGDGIA